MKRLSVFARAASVPASCCSRWNTALDRPRRALSTTHTRHQRDTNSEQPKNDVFLPNGMPNPKYKNPRPTLKSLPEEWQKAFEEKKAELESEEESPDKQYMRLAKQRTDKLIFNFDGPGGTNARGYTKEQQDAINRSPPLQRNLNIEQGFFALEEEKNDPGEDPEFNADDITSDAHGELEQHREMREFARVIAWDMPLLWHHRKEFEPPTAEKQPLRFRYTTYLGETHPASRKVVVDFTPSAFPDLTPIQLSKLIKLLGVRFNPSTETAKMSCELFPSAAQNKRYLGDLIDKLIVEAKDGKDTFEDVPFDFRHHKFKKKIEFPEEWKMTEERRIELDKKRAKTAQEGQVGRLVDGTAPVQDLEAQKEQDQPMEQEQQNRQQAREVQEEQEGQEEPVMIPAGRNIRS